MEEVKHCGAGGIEGLGAEFLGFSLKLFVTFPLYLLANCFQEQKMIEKLSRLEGALFEEFLRMKQNV